MEMKYLIAFSLLIAALFGLIGTLEYITQQNRLACIKTGQDAAMCEVAFHG